MSLLVMTRCYFPALEVERFAGRMMATARRVGLNPQPFGVGEVMSTHGGSGEGPGAIDFMKTRTEEYVLCCDCMDVAFLAGEDEIMDKFLSMKSDFIVSTERGSLRGMEASAAVLSLHDGFFKSINVGLWIAKRTHAIDVIQAAIDQFRHHEDTHGQDTLQAWLPLMYVAGTGPEFELDRDCNLFQSMAGMSPDIIAMEGKRVRNVATGTHPIAIHYNGDKNGFSYSAIVEHLLS